MPTTLVEYVLIASPCLVVGLLGAQMLLRERARRHAAALLTPSAARSRLPLPPIPARVPARTPVARTERPLAFAPAAPARPPRAAPPPRAAAPPPPMARPVGPIASAVARPPARIAPPSRVASNLDRTPPRHPRRSPRPRTEDIATGVFLRRRRLPGPRLARGTFDGAVVDPRRS